MAVGVMEGRELCNIYYKKPGKCTWKIRSRSGKSQGKVRGGKISKSVGTLAVGSLFPTEVGM